MNWGAVTAACVAAFWIVMIGTEVLRSIVDRRRLQRDGMGGTQDILLWGLGIAIPFAVGAIVGAMFWALSSLRGGF